MEQMASFNNSDELRQLVEISTNFSNFHLLHLSSPLKSLSVNI